MACGKDAADYFPVMFKTMRWGQGEYVLDMGCGNGNSTIKYILPEVKSRNGKLYGLERTQHVVDQAKEKCPEINWVCGDVMDKSVLEGVTFDKIFSMHVLNYFTDVPDITNNLVRQLELLKPGGQIGHLFLTLQTMAIARNKIKDKEMEHTGYKPNAADWTAFEPGKGEATFTKIFEDAGFKVKELKVVTDREHCSHAHGQGHGYQVQGGGHGHDNHQHTASNHGTGSHGHDHHQGHHTVSHGGAGHGHQGQCDKGHMDSSEKTCDVDKKEAPAKKEYYEIVYVVAEKSSQ